MKFLNPEKLDEASIGRFWHFFNDTRHCICIISAHRSERPGLTDQQNREVNNKNTIRLRQDVSLHISEFKDAGFHRARGGYTETLKDGTKRDVYEASTVIYALCETKYEELVFKNFCRALGEKFEQESIFFVTRNRTAFWITTLASKGNPLGKHVNCGKFHSQQIGKYFTQVGKNRMTFECEDNAFTNCLWWRCSLNEHREYNTMAKKLRILTGQGKDYYAHCFKDSRMPEYNFNKKPVMTLQEAFKQALKTEIGVRY